MLLFNSICMGQKMQLLVMMISFYPTYRFNQRIIVTFLLLLMMIMTMTTTTIQNNNPYQSSTQMITLIDAFQIPTIVTIVRSVKQQRQLQHHHPNYQQPTSSVFIPRRSRSSFLIRTIRSAVSYGRTDDSEWYTDVTTTTIKTTDSEPSSISYSPITPTTSSSPSSLSSVLSYQTSITCSEQFDNIFHKNNHNNNTNQLIIIKFYASWCKSCKKVQSKINQFILEEFIIPNNTNQQQMIHFYNVEYNTNHELCKQNNITQLPTIHIYRSCCKTVCNDHTTTNNNSMIGNYMKVQDFPCPPRDFYRLRDYIKFYLHQQHQHDGNDDEHEELLDNANLIPMDTPLITNVKNTNHDNTNNGTTKYNIATSNITNISTSSSNSILLDMGHDMIQTSILPTIIMENNSKIDNNESSITGGRIPFETKQHQQQQQQLDPSSSTTLMEPSSSTTTTTTKHEQLFGWFFRHLRP